MTQKKNNIQEKNDTKRCEIDKHTHTHTHTYTSIEKNNEDGSSADLCFISVPLLFHKHINAINKIGRKTNVDYHSLAIRRKQIILLIIYR